MSTIREFISKICQFPKYSEVAVMQFPAKCSMNFNGFSVFRFAISKFLIVIGFTSSTRRLLPSELIGNPLEVFCCALMDFFEDFRNKLRTFYFSFQPFGVINCRSV